MQAQGTQLYQSSTKPHETDNNRTKSILKQAPLSTQENLTEPLLLSSLPELSSTQTADNNTTSRINAVGAPKLDKATRRVSFAPDVTLHSFDFVPTNNSEDAQLAASRDASVSLEVDSSMTMDITAPVAVAPKPVVAVDGRLDTEATQKYNDDDDDDDDDQSMEFTMRQERLSPIILSFNEDGSNANGNSKDDTNGVESIEMIEPMELTQPIKSKKQSAPSIGTIATTAATVANSNSNSETVANVRPAELVPDGIDTHDDEMEFTMVNRNLATSLQDATHDGIGREVGKSDSDLDSMEMTQPLPGNATQSETTPSGNIDNNNRGHNDDVLVPVSSAEDKAKSATVVPAVSNEYVTSSHPQTRHETNKKLPLTSRIPKPGSRINQYTHIARSTVGVKSNIPRISTGRKRSMSFISHGDDNDLANDRKRQSLRRKSTAPEDVTSMERMSPIRLTAFDSSLHNSSQGSSVGVSSTHKPGLELQPAHIHTLNDFIERANVGFPTNMADGVVQKTITFPSVKVNEDTYFKVRQLYDALYNQFPVIQMDVFIIKELLSIDKQLRESFSDLDRQISSSTSQPTILRNYFTSDPSQRVNMNTQLQLVKSYSRTEAKKSLDEWYLAQLKNLRSVLIENLALLTREHAKVESTLKSCRSIKSRVVDIKEMLQKEVSLLRNPETTKKAAVTNETEIATFQYIRAKIIIRSLEREMSKHGKSIKQIAELRRQADTLSAEIARTRQQLKRLDGVHSDKLSEPELLLRELSFLESVSGVQFTSFKGRNLSFKVPGVDDDVTFNLRLPSRDVGTGGYIADDILTVSGKLSQDKVLNYFCTQIRSEWSQLDRGDPTDATSTTTKNVNAISHLIRAARDATQLWRQYKLLEMMFPTHLTLLQDNKSGSTPGIDILDYNMTSKDEVRYRISLDTFRKAITNPTSSIQVDVAATSEIHRKTLSDLNAHFIKRVSRVFPSFTEDRVRLNVLR